MEDISLSLDQESPSLSHHFRLNVSRVYFWKVHSSYSTTLNNTTIWSIWDGIVTSFLLSFVFQEIRSVQIKSKQKSLQRVLMSLLRASSRSDLSAYFLHSCFDKIGLTLSLFSYCWFAEAILEKNLDELYVMWQRRPPHVQISVSWWKLLSCPIINAQSLNKQEMTGEFPGINNTPRNSCPAAKNKFSGYWRICRSHRLDYEDQRKYLSNRAPTPLLTQY